MNKLSLKEIGVRLERGENKPRIPLSLSMKEIGVRADVYKVQRQRIFFINNETR